MNHKQCIAVALVLAAFGSAVLPGGMSTAYAEGDTQKPADTVSAEIAKPLQEAQELYKQKKYPEALVKLNEASALKKTPYEAYTVDRTRAAVASASGDVQLQLESYQAVVASGRLTPNEQSKFVQAISRLYYNKADYVQAISWAERFFKEGGTDPQLHELLVNSYYLNNDLPSAAKELQIDLDAAEKAGTAPTEKQLRILISIATKQNDKVGYVNALEKLAAYYPKKEYWIDLLGRLQSKAEFSTRLTLDLYRLKFSMGLMTRPGEYLEMAELAMLAGFPAEAKKVMDAGYTSGALGKGGDLEKQKSVLNLANKKIAEDLKTIVQTEADVRKNKDGLGLINLGYAFVTTGQFDKGLEMMEQGVSAPGLKRADEVKLHLATAYALAGRNADAIQKFKAVQGNDGSGDLARYWVLQLTHPIP